ncbi:MAG: hypothetical protein AAF485_19495 [Chloroflexota bacterium]
MSEHHHHPDDNYDEKIEKMTTLTVKAAKELMPVGQVLLPLTQIANGDLAPPEAREFARALARILSGERDPIDLVKHLTPELTETLWETLDRIEAPFPEEEEEDDEREAITFEQLVEKIAEACSGEVTLWQQLWEFTEELATDERNPESIKTLGLALRKILAGERQKYVLDDLAEEHRWAVEEMLDWLNERALVPPETE